MRTRLAVVLCFLTSCAEVSNPLLGDGGAGGGTTGGGTTGGGTTGGGTTGGGTTGGGTGGGAACTEDWTCSPWSVASNMATRTCIDQNACGTTTNQPMLTATPPALDLNFYKCRVEPIFDRSCASVGCHGDLNRALRIFARGRLRNSEMVTRIAGGCNPPIPAMFNLDVQCSQNKACDCSRPHTATEWQLNFDSARGFAIGLASPADSELLTQPLVGTSFAHASRKFLHTTDADYQTILNWLQGNTLATCNTGAN
ncbi:MAG: hypothetical protein JNM17_25210 [Archangium sp.]|nr:hypothetical protein [Archangium sp.]